MALNIAEKGFPIAVYNRSYDKTEAAVKRAEKEGASCVLLFGFRNWRKRLPSARRPRGEAPWLRDGEGFRCELTKAQVRAVITRLCQRRVIQA